MPGRNREILTPEDELKLVATVKADPFAPEGQDAFGQIYQRHAPSMARTASKIVAPLFVEDVVQDSSLRAWHGIGKYNPMRSRLGSWLLTITRNVAIDYYRRPANRPSKSFEESTPEDRLGYEPDIGHRISFRQMVESIREVPNAHLLLDEGVGITNSEGSVREEIPLGTYKGRVRAARTRSRELLADFT